MSPLRPSMNTTRRRIRRKRFTTVKQDALWRKYGGLI